MSTDPKEFWSSAVKMFVVLILVTSGLLVLGGTTTTIESVDAEPTREGGPIVNRSAVTDESLRFILHEDFESVDYLVKIARNGSSDIFYDPSDEWDDTAFTIKYPSGFSRETTPITVKIESYPLAEVFGWISISPNGDNSADWNMIKYGQEYFKVTITAVNDTGTSTSEIWFSVLSVNDRPTEIGTGNFFSIIVQEDENYWGINEDNDPPNEVMGDLKDPYDTLTFSVEKSGEASKHIEVEILPDGSYISFTPEKDWSSPYRDNPKQRYPKSEDPNQVDLSVFGHFKINCTDQNGLALSKNFYVYVMPVNDTPVFESEGDHYFDEDELVYIELTASDADPETDQRLVFGTNISQIINDRTGVQLEFQDEYDFDAEDGTIEFITDNSMVGVYPVAAWVDDRYAKDVPPRMDYPTTDFKVYSNFTLHIVNVNDPPKAVIDNPIETFIYNTTWPITFDATRSTDPDIIHGDNLTYTWYKDGVEFGTGATFEALIEEEGNYRIKVNVSDGEFSRELIRNIEVEKTRILGEIFKGKDLERSYTDNRSDPLVFKKSQEDMNMEFAGPNSLDIVSITGGRGDNPNIYKIKIMFGNELNYVFTEDKEQEPSINIYFLTPDFTEDRIAPTIQDIPSYTFPVPMSNFRYTRMEFDIRQVSVIYYQLQDSAPSIRKLDTNDGIEVSMSIAEMDQIGIKPDFEIYATAHVRTQVKLGEGSYTIYTSWDSAGEGSNSPQVGDDVKISKKGDNGSSTGLILIIIIVLVLIIVIAVAVVLFVLLGSKKDKDEQPGYPQGYVAPQPEQTVDQMVFGEQQQATAQQMYGAPPQEQLPQGGTPAAETLPPAQPEVQPQEQAPVSGELPPAEPQSVPQNIPPADQNAAQTEAAPQVQMPPQ